MFRLGHQEPSASVDDLQKDQAGLLRKNVSYFLWALSAPEGVRTWKELLFRGESRLCPTMEYYNGCSPPHMHSALNVPPGVVRNYATSYYEWCQLRPWTPTEL